MIEESPWNAFCRNWLKCVKMNQRVKNLSAAQLRTIIIHEMRKFAMALEYGATVSDLQEIKEQIKELTDLLTMKEQAETFGITADISPQSNMSATA
jgi:hypothetical protein